LGGVTIAEQLQKKLIAHVSMPECRAAAQGRLPSYGFSRPVSPFYSPPLSRTGMRPWKLTGDIFSPYRHIQNSILLKIIGSISPEFSGLSPL
jgi:hypothetical protein